MTRTLAAAVDSYLSEPVLDFRLLADVTFTNTVMRLHTGVGSLMVGSTHYDGIGNLGGVERVTEGSDNFTAPVKVWLSAVDSAPLSEAINEQLFGKPVTLSRCWLNNGTVVNTPEVWYIGKIGQVDIHRNNPERGNYIELGLQSRIDMVIRPQYYTAEDLAMVYSGDTFFNYLSLIANQKSHWGSDPTGFNNDVNYGSLFRSLLNRNRGR